MEISASTRSVVKRNHAVISPDGFINSKVPGWDNCTVNVIINEQMGANLTQTIITANKDCKLSGVTKKSQIFFYVIKGNCTANISGNSQQLSAGQFVYVPVEKEYAYSLTLKQRRRFLHFTKYMKALEGYNVPGVLFGDAAKVPGPSYLGDDALAFTGLIAR